MKEVTYSMTSVNDGGYGFKINITFHPSHRGHCDFDIVWVADHEETDQYCGVLMEHDDLDRLQNLIGDARSESMKRLPEVEDEDYEVDIADFLGDDD